jgi:glycosyltransferase involved in cell wall biosynthesis
VSLHLWQLDPAQLTPYYNLAVCDALAQAGARVRYITSRFLYDDTLPQSSSYQTDWVYFRGLDNPRLVHYPRIRRGLRALSYPLGHWRVLREARQQRPQIIHIQWSRLPKIDLLLIRRLQALGIPIVHTVHDVVPLFALDSKTSALEAVYKTVDRLVVHTEANLEDFLRVYPDVPANRLRVIPLIEFSEVETPLGADKRKARQKLGLPLEHPVVLFFGAIRYYKGVDVLLKAFENARSKRQDLQLLIAGKSDPLESDKVPSVEEIRSLPNVHLYEGFIPHQDLWAYYTAADIIVHPYRHITQSAALITAMGFGRPVIVTDVGGMPETIDGNGWIVPKEDPDGLAKALLEAVMDQARLKAMGRRSREIIDERHSGAFVGQRLMAIYQELLHERESKSEGA